MVDRFGIRVVAESFRSRWCTDRRGVILSDDSRLKCFSLGGGGAATNIETLLVVHNQKEMGRNLRGTSGIKPGFLRSTYNLLSATLSKNAYCSKRVTGWNPMREYCLRCSTHQMFVGLPTTPSAASKVVTSGSSPGARSKQNSPTGAGGLRAVLGRMPASFSSAVRGLGGCGGEAAGRPHSAHRTQCECQRWNVPRRTQSSSIVLSQLMHTSESAALGTGLLEGEGGQKGESPAYSSARLRYPYFTPLVPATPPSA
jgi:hypothetical protein